MFFNFAQMTPDIPIISLKSINLQMQDNSLFKQFDLTVFEAENSCIAGPSGKGKSSLLKLFQGYLLPQSGIVEICGYKLSPDTVQQIRSQIAYVPQNIHLPVKNGVELLAMIAAERKANSAKNFLQMLGMEAEMLHRSFDEMSGGQKQRVVIAVCLSLERKLLLLDEPTVSLDEESITHLIKCITALKNTTVISASHNDQWMAAAQKIIQL